MQMNTIMMNIGFIKQSSYSLHVQYFSPLFSKMLHEVVEALNCRIFKFWFKDDLYHHSKSSHALTILLTHENCLTRCLPLDSLPCQLDSWVCSCPQCVQRSYSLGIKVLGIAQLWSCYQVWIFIMSLRNIRWGLYIPLSFSSSRAGRSASLKMFNFIETITMWWKWYEIVLY